MHAVAFILEHEHDPKKYLEATLDLSFASGDWQRTVQTRRSSYRSSFSDATKEIRSKNRSDSEGEDVCSSEQDILRREQRDETQASQASSPDIHVF